MKLFVLFLSLFIAPLHAVFALVPGTAQGSLQVNGEIILLSRAYAHLHDNAEGLLDRRKELRILLVDREVPQDALAGLVFLPGQHMATEGQVRGLSISATGQEALKKLEFTSIRRVVVRGERAVAIFADKQWANFVREGREWKSDD